MKYAPETLVVARHLIQTRGAEALGRARCYAEDLRLKGDLSAAEMWQEIARAIRSIEAGDLEE